MIVRVSVSVLEVLVPVATAVALATVAAENPVVVLLIVDGLGASALQEVQGSDYPKPEAKAR